MVVLGVIVDLWTGKHKHRTTDAIAAKQFRGHSFIEYGWDWQQVSQGFLPCISISRSNPPKETLSVSVGKQVPNNGSKVMGKVS